MSIDLLIALFCSLSGVALLRLAWRTGSRRPDSPSHHTARWSGWLLLSVALPTWGIALGADRGVATGLLLTMLAGLALVLQAGYAERRPRRKGRSERQPDRVSDPAVGPNAEAGSHGLARRVWIFMLAGPLAATAALALGLLLWLALERAGVHPANVLTSAVLFVPLAWALLASLALLNLQLLPRSLAVLGLLLAGASGSLLLAGGAA